MKKFYIRLFNMKKKKYDVNIFFELMHSEHF